MNPHDLVWLDKPVLYGLLQSEPRLLFVFQNSDVEGESASLLLHLGKDGTGRLHLELICNRRILLIDRCSGFLQSSLLNCKIRECIVGADGAFKGLSRTLPSSPELTRISTPQTSPSANVAASNSRFWASDGLRTILFFPSMTFCSC